MYDKLEVENF